MYFAIYAALALLYLVPAYLALHRGHSNATAITLLNVLAGWTPAEDTLPERFLDSPLPNDAVAHLSRERLGALVMEYHRQRGW